MKYRRIDVYVPETHAEAVKQALFAAGAGGIGNYDCCCFQTVGRGQFRPLDGSSPYLGSSGRVEHVTEWKLEMIFPEEKLRVVISALRRVHPFETAALQHWCADAD